MSDPVHRVDVRAAPARGEHALRLRRLGIDTSQEFVVYMPSTCTVCRSEGFEAQGQIRIQNGGRSLIARLNVINSDLVPHGEVGLSESAWTSLEAREGDEVTVSHPDPVESLGVVRGKLYGRRFESEGIRSILGDILAGRYLDVHIAAFVLGCGPGRLDRKEMVALTRSMVDAGERLEWGAGSVADKHCVGGLPGNRTTMIVVPIIAAAGLTIPKTSSRAITSPAGTADAMETVAPVHLDLAAMRRVVDREGGCIVWGGAVHLSPVDDILIRVERALDIDSEGTLVASVLSKKKAAGSTHVVLDIPVGPTAKVRTPQEAARLAGHFHVVAKALGLKIAIAMTDGTQPVGRGIGPALEARSVLAVLRREAGARLDLRDRALALAGRLLELAGRTSRGKGVELATALLDDGRAWKKFVAIAEAQGGLKEPPESTCRWEFAATRPGIVSGLDNRQIAKAAKLAGAPKAPAAGVDLGVGLGSRVERGQPLFVVHAETPGELAYARAYVEGHPSMIEFREAP
jgi:thymidine phosphorylase